MNRASAFHGGCQLLLNYGSFLQGLMKATRTTPRPHSRGRVDENEGRQGAAVSLLFLCHSCGQGAQNLVQLLFVGLGPVAPKGRGRRIENIQDVFRRQPPIARTQRLKLLLQRAEGISAPELLLAHFRKTVAIRSDGTLWVSEKPRRPWNEDRPQPPEEFLRQLQASRLREEEGAYVS